MLLLSLTNLVGSIGYERNSFYSSVSPYWSSFLVTTSIFSLAMMVASFWVFWYLTYNYKLSLCYIPIPWLILHAIILGFLVAGLIMLLTDMNNHSRLEMEDMLGKGNYAMVITLTMVSILYIWLGMMVAYVHMDEKIMEKEIKDMLDKLYSKTNIREDSSNMC